MSSKALSSLTSSGFLEARLFFSEGLANPLFPFLKRRVGGIFTKAGKSKFLASAVAIYKGVEGKLYKFDVVLYDPAGEVGKGTHTRAIIKTERLMLGAVNRVNQT